MTRRALHPLEAMPAAAPPPISPMHAVLIDRSRSSADPVMVAEPVGERLTDLGPRAWLLGWVVVGSGAAIGAVGHGLRVPLGAHLGMQAYGLGHAIALGLLTTAWAGGVRRLSPGAPVFGTALLALLLGLALVPADLAGPAGRMAARTGLGGWAWLGALAVALAVPAAELVARGLARFAPARAGAIVVALLVAIGNHFLLPLRHPALHLFAAWGAAALVAGAFATSPWPRRVAPRGSLALAVGLAMLAVLVPPSPKSADLLARTTGSVLFPWRARLTASREAAWRPARPPTSAWFHARDGAPWVAATRGAPRPSAPVVVLLSVDALRADVLTDPSDADATRTLRELHDASVAFTSARAPSNRTVATLASVFSGRPFSSLRWTEREHPISGVNVWPHGDTDPRLAHLLSRAGVHTVNVASTDYLTDEYGAVAGFAEDRVVAAVRGGVGPGRQPPWAAAADVADVIIAELAEVAPSDRPTFVFAHFLDAHDPYDQGDAPPGADARTRWRAEVAVVDAAVGRIVAAIDELGLSARTTVILTADHGEAFGEHGADRHGTSLYDEVLRVPLLIRSPTHAPRIVGVPVTLLDLGPTILDLFDQPTPGTWFGQSLVPLLLGHAPTLDRPLVFEARPKQALLRADGIKVMRDLRLGTLEAYDLARDPAETENLFDGTPEAREELFAELAAFFAAHEHREPGYATPIR